MGSKTVANSRFNDSGPFVINAPQPVVCRLGQIVYAGTKWDSRATYAHAPAPDFMRPSIHFLLVLTLEGEADYADSTGVRAVMRPGTLMWACPGVDQSYGPRPGVRWSEFYMWFDGPIFEAWQAQGFPGRQTRMLALSSPDYWMQRLREIVLPSAQMKGESHLALLCRFQQVLADALQFSETSPQSEESLRWRERACQLLVGGNTISTPLEDIAAELGMSYTAFRKRFVQLTDKSPGHYRTEEIIRCASTRLLKTDDTLEQIAGALGFHDAFHFSRRFKQVVGIAPDHFRRQHRSGHS
jgi:AraC-like DNA-binding protein